MISNNLKRLFLISIPVYIIHGMEEYLTGFYNIDSFSRFVFQYFENLPSLQATFLLFQVMSGVLLIVSYLLIQGGRWTLILATIFGLVFLFELHHIVKVVEIMGYYPGIASALLIYLIGYFYWKELIKNWRKNNGRN